MPTPRLSLNVLQIQTPCDADWHVMSGTATRRHCADCDLHVHDLAALPRRKAEQLLAQSQTQRVCARVTRDAQGQIITRDRLRTARNRFAAAAGLALSVIGLTGCGDRADASSSPTGPTPVPPHSSAAGGIRVAPAPLAGAIAAVPELGAPIAVEPPLEIMGEVVAQPPIPAPAPVRGRIAVGPAQGPSEAD